MARYTDDRSSVTTSSSSTSGGGARWDAERFYREREERHTREPSRRRERRPTVGVAEREREREQRPTIIDDYLRGEEQQRYGPPARAANRTYNDDHLVHSSEEIVPYRSRRDASLSRRPTLLRRQSSLDTFDRAAQRRAYHEYDSEDYGPPVTAMPAPIPMPRQRRRTPPRYADSDFEEIRIAEPEYYGDEEFHILRDRARSETPRGRDRSAFRREHVLEKTIERPYPRRGKTRIPKRLVHPKVIIDLGYPFEDEGNTVLILKALGKENIDEIVTLSKEIRTITDTTKEKITIDPNHRDHLTVERRRSKSRRRTITSDVERREVRTRSRARSSVRPYTPVAVPMPIAIPVPAPSPRPRRRRRSSPIRIIEPRHSDHDVISPRADVALILPDRTRRSDRDIREEIRMLEAERQALRAEREGGMTTTTTTDVVDEVEVKRDHKGPSPRLIRAMMATLT
ncbi:hypothetical protein AJ80_00198 [Polytolypa hystricis UAMH7299]|uniref:DUF8035 domain-containing protein n=1 Tax=Polytolypa hystricis (strain UAMH7299) TaxID=1447883 RepID=A0A2B7YV44_POLH7|nr:hypothetical protein AJ80_00198 [Polytolypa hystricis UAMH7299]